MGAHEKHAERGDRPDWIQRGQDRSKSGRLARTVGAIHRDQLTRASLSTFGSDNNNTRWT
jgi:hypothetical protein